MLVLSRKPGEKIIINDEIEIVLIDSSNGMAKIGINAPKSVSIYREELYREIKTTNKTSNDTSFDAINAIQSLLQDSNVKDDSSQILENLTAKIKKDE